VDHLDAGKDRRGAGHRLETEHGPDPALNAPMVLLDAVVQILALPDADRLQRPPWAVLLPAFTVAGNDRLPVGLAAVDDNPFRPTMTFHHLADEADNKSRCWLKKNSTVSPALSMAREIHPLAARLDVGFVDMPPADHALSPVESLQQ
jgi:hypothetical protein